MKKNMLQMMCPRCGGRAFDISEIPKNPIMVELKCPRCRNIIRVPCGFGSRYKQL